MGAEESIMKASLADTLQNVMIKIKANGEGIRKQEKEYEQHLAANRHHQISNSGVGYLGKVVTLDDIKPKHPQQTKLIKTLSAWNYGRGTLEPLPYLFGSNGTGKSYIAKRFVATIIKKFGVQAKFISFSQFLIKYRDFTDGSTKLDEVTFPSVVVLDDLFSHNITQQTLEVLHACIDYRIANNRPTLITSNVRADRIADELFSRNKKKDSMVLCKAIEDRIFELCTFCTMQFDSLRIELAKARIKKIRNEND